MPCYVPFNDRSLDVTFAVVKPMGVLSEELIDTMKCFSYHAEMLGCVYGSIFKSIHGNLIVWYGAWLKRSPENLEILSSILSERLAELSKQAVIVEHGFFKPFGGESKETKKELKQSAKLSNGDTVFMLGMEPGTDIDPSDLAYACLALLRSYFSKTNGIISAVCLMKQIEHHPYTTTTTTTTITTTGNYKVGLLQVWKSLEECYSWLLHSDHRNTLRPFVAHLSEVIQFDMFKVVYVSTDDVVNSRFFHPPPQPQTTTSITSDPEQEHDHDQDSFVE